MAVAAFGSGDGFSYFKREFFAVFLFVFRGCGRLIFFFGVFVGGVFVGEVGGLPGVVAYAGFGDCFWVDYYLGFVAGVELSVAEVCGGGLQGVEEEACDFVV